MTPVGPGEEPVNDEDGNLVAVGYTPANEDPIEECWSDERLAELHVIDEAARRIAPSLVGLTMAQAQELVDQHADVNVAFRHPRRPYRPMHVFGQINALVIDGVVTETM